jgi:di/tricarboxylate transporter
MDTLSFFDEKPMRLPHKIIAAFLTILLIIGTAQISMGHAHGGLEVTKVFLIGIGIGIIGVIALVVFVVVGLIVYLMAGVLMVFIITTIYKKIRRGQGVGEEDLVKETVKVEHVLENIYMYGLVIALIADFIYQHFLTTGR